MRLLPHLPQHLFFISFLILISLNSKAQKTEITDDSIALELHIDSLFQHYNNPQTPGAAIAIIHHGKMKLAKAYGSANLEYDIPNDLSTIFNVASVSKQFTAFAILLLQERGKLSLDDDVRKYIPEVPDFGHTITLRHLAYHTSGLRDQLDLLIINGVRPDDVINNDHVLSMINEQKDLNFTPGDEYLYCNTGYTLLAEVVSRVSGQSFAAFTRENIFSPLQMNSTLFHDDHEKIIKNRAYSYYSRGNEGFFKRELNHGNVGPSNLLTTVEDLGFWMINFLNPKVGSADIFKQMTTQGTLNNGKSSGSAPGLFINDYRGLTEIEHGGAHAGFRAQVSMFPSQEFGVVVLSNNANCNARMLAAEVLNFCLNDFFEENQPKQPQKERKYISLKPKMMKSFVGHYWTKEHAYTRHIYLKGDTLMHFRTANNESPLASISKNEFQVMNVPVDALVRFEEQNGEMRMYETVNDRAPILLEKFVPVDYSHEDWLKYEGDYYSDEIKTVYEIEWAGEKLIAKHMRMGNIELKLIKHNFFSGDRGFFGSVEFLRNKAGNVTGFRVSNGRVRNLLFTKSEHH